MGTWGHTAETKREKIMKWQFKEDHTLDQRCQESNKIRQKYPDRIPVIVQKVEGSNIEKIDKRKYLVPADITAAQFMWIIRKRINLPSERAIFLFVDKMVPQSRTLLNLFCLNESFLTMNDFYFI